MNILILMKLIGSNKTKPITTVIYLVDENGDYIIDENNNKIIVE